MPPSAALNARVPDVLAGIFVGGASTRMGGRAKGLLERGGSTLVDRWRATFDALGIEHVLVGRRAEYASVPLAALPDDPPGVGPIGGLAALLAAAGDRRALAVACDMPFVTRQDVEALLAAPRAPAVAPRRDGRWEPLCALYNAPMALPVVRARIAAGHLSLQGLLNALGAREIEIDGAHLADWDSPQDLDERSAS